MSDTEEIVLPDDIQEEIEEQAESADIKPHECSDDDRVRCATVHGLRAVENKILISISENINTMAGAITSEKQSRKKMQKVVK